MFIVSKDVDVEKLLVDRSISCGCGGWLGPWGYGRKREVRGVVRSFRPRRGRCDSCGVTHVLLPWFCLLRRFDSVEVIGEAISLSGRGVGVIKIASFLGCPATTVRRWLARARANSSIVIGALTQFLLRLEPGIEVVVASGSLRGLLDICGRVVGAVSRRNGLSREVAVWPLISLLMGGRLLSPDLNSRFATPLGV